MAAPVIETWAALRNAAALAEGRFDPARLEGNHVINGSRNVYALYAHLAPGSVTVSNGEPILAGQLVGVSATPATRRPRTCTSN